MCSIYYFIIISGFYCLHVSGISANINSATNIVIPTISNEDNISKCITNILEKYHLKYVLIIISTELRLPRIWKASSSITKLSFKESFLLFPRLKFTEFFVLILNNINELRDWLVRAIKYFFFNPRGKFIFIIDHENDSSF